MIRILMHLHFSQTYLSQTSWNAFSFANCCWRLKMILVFLVVAAVVKPKCKIKRSLNFVILNPRKCDLVLVKLARFLLFTGERVTRFSAGGGVS